MRKFVVVTGVESCRRESAFHLKGGFRYFYLEVIYTLSLLIFCLSLPFLPQKVYTVCGQTIYQSQLVPGQPSSNYVKNSQAFRQEIMRLEINVTRGDQTLPITQVPRVQKDDVIKMRLLDEAVGGIKPDQSMWNWTLLVAFVNPNRRSIDQGDNKQRSVSEEIQFRKSGWYKQYSFVVPYDSQPVFFLYPKPKYRDKILRLVSRNYEEVRKLGEKTIEIAGAYAQIGSFLNELQTVLYQTQYSRYANNNLYGGNSYPYNYNNPYYPNGNSQAINVPYNYNALIEQTIERLARSFNISLPNCWQSGGSYNVYGNNTYNSGSIYGGYNSYGGYGSYGNQNSFGYAISSDLIARAQCVAKNVKIEDFDFSISQLLKQGGILAATQLRDKYPQLAYWINIAAAALDFIIKVFQKSPLKIVPTIVQSNDTQQTANGYANNSMPYSSNGSSAGMVNSPNSYGATQPASTKITLYAESQPDDTRFITAYPIVVHKWQSDPDPEIISLAPPVLTTPCLHAGVNLLKNANITDDAPKDNFAKNFKLVMSSLNGFRKEFPLKKNPGLGGWELNLTKEDLSSFPKIEMKVESYITGTRGFNEIKSPVFDLPISIGGAFEITPESQKSFAVGGKRTVSLRNSLGSCRCLQAVIYKPNFGGQFVFEADSADPNHRLQFTFDGREAFFEIDATNFQSGAGTLELKTFGGESSVLNLKLYPLPPDVSDVKISKGDNQVIITGDRLEQIKFVKINGKRATIIADNKINQPLTNNIGGGNSLPTNPQNSFSNSATERIAVFDDPNTVLTDNNISVELGLEDNRIFQLPKTFTSFPSRPKIVTNGKREIAATAINGFSVQTTLAKSFFDANKIAVFSIETTQISLNAQNALTDYDFKAENLSIETRIEKSQVNNGYGADIAAATFEVLDWKNLRINFQINEQGQKLLGGRRLQFRIRDAVRGDSDWYTVKQTFVRLPRVVSVKCANEMNGMCEMHGENIDYISQVSTDGGKSWFPDNSGTFQTQILPDGMKSAMIPRYSDKKLLIIKLRDFPAMQGLNVTDYSFVNAVKGSPAKKNQPPVDKPLSTNMNAPNLPTKPGNSNTVPIQNVFPKFPGETPNLNPLVLPKKGKRDPK